MYIVVVFFACLFYKLCFFSMWLGFLSTWKQTFRSLKQSFQKSVKIFTNLSFTVCVNLYRKPGVFEVIICVQSLIMRFYLRKQQWINGWYNQNIAHFNLSSRTFYCQEKGTSTLLLHQGEVSDAFIMSPHTSAVTVGTQWNTQLDSTQWVLLF